MLLHGIILTKRIPKSILILRQSYTKHVDSHHHHHMIWQSYPAENYSEPQTLPCPVKRSSVSVDELLACLLSSRLVVGLSAVLTFGPSDWWWWTISDVYLRATMAVHDPPVCDTIFCWFCSHIWHKYWTHSWQESNLHPFLVYYIPQTPKPLLEKGANLTFAHQNQHGGKNCRYVNMVRVCHI